MSMADSMALLVFHYGKGNCRKAFTVKDALEVRLVNPTNISSRRKGSV